MIGAWDVFDLNTPDGTLTFGTPQWDARFTAALARGIATLRGAGSKVALSLLPCYRPVRKSAGFWPERGDDDRTRHVNTLLRAAVQPDAVYALEPPAQFCTNEVIAADLTYRWDGVHYYRPGAALYFRAVIPQLQKIAKPG
jgi:hypothetical protein